LPIKIRWTSREYISWALMLFGACGLFQVLFIFLGQYFLRVGNYIIIIVIPSCITLALFFASIIIFESFAQVERKKKLRFQFRKIKYYSSGLKAFLGFPLTRPLIIVFGVFTPFFFASFYVSLMFLDYQFSFIIAEDFGAIMALLIANYIEKKYARIRRY